MKTKPDIRLIQLNEENAAIVAEVMGVSEEAVKVVMKQDRAYNMVRYFQIEYVDGKPKRVWL